MQNTNEIIRAYVNIFDLKSNNIFILILFVSHDKSVSSLKLIHKLYSSNGLFPLNIIVPLNKGHENH